MTTTTVAIVGGGPAGMFFLHALETYQRELQEKGEEAALEALPEVTCLERASGPGGVWRAKRSFDNDAEKTTNMYEALWLNGCKEPIEFGDYTFDEHFKCALPVYLPRQAFLDYMLGRVIKHCPTFFEKYLQFNTTVTSVKYDKTKSKFVIVTKKNLTGEVSTNEYDKCIWAAGQNGKPSLPARLVSMLREGGFRGRMIHSTDTANLEADVKNKRVLFIGGSYSAEDLALMAVKVGAAKVYISSRSESNVVTWTSAWPLNKVEVLINQAPVGVTNDGKTIQFAKTNFVYPEDYETGTTAESEIHDIDTIIFCTGYASNLDMLDEELRAPLINDYLRVQVPVPSDWKMRPNEMTSMVGEVEPGDVRWPYTLRYPELYRGVVIANPNMMFLEYEWFPFPLTGIDVNAWMLMRIVTGTFQLPSAEEMRQQNLNDALDQLQIPYLRYCVDHNYQKAYYSNKDPAGENRKIPYWKRLYYKSYPQYTRMHYRIIARTAQEAQYPVSFGTYEKTNEIVDAFVNAGDWGYEHRSTLIQDENAWRTFRDVANPERHRSVFTGTKSVPLKGRWLDLDASDESIVRSDEPVRIFAEENREKT